MFNFIIDNVYAVYLEDQAETDYVSGLKKQLAEEQAMIAALEKYGILKEEFSKELF